MTAISKKSSAFEHSMKPSHLGQFNKLKDGGSVSFAYDIKIGPKDFLQSLLLMLPDLVIYLLSIVAES